MNTRLSSHLVRVSLCFLLLLSLGCAAKPPSSTYATLQKKPEDSVQEQKKPVIIPTAEKALGTPYKYGGTTINGFDCSGFVQWVYSHAGIKLPRKAVEQSRVGKAIKDKKSIEVGDIVAFKHPRRGYHTGIYVGEGQFIHSPRRNTVIKLDTLSEGYFSKSFLGARRVADLKATEEGAAQKLLASYEEKITQAKLKKSKAVKKKITAKKKKSSKKSTKVTKTQAKSKNKTANKKTEITQTSSKKTAQVALNSKSR